MEVQPDGQTKPLNATAYNIQPYNTSDSLCSRDKEYSYVRHDTKKYHQEISCSDDFGIRNPVVNKMKWPKTAINTSIVAGGSRNPHHNNAQ